MINFVNILTINAYKENLAYVILIYLNLYCNNVGETLN